jgi:hypothetical protein
MIEIPLSRGLVALVDDADADAVRAVGKWYANPSDRAFYARKNFQVRPGQWVSVRMHTFLTGWPLVDHRNGDGLDNRRANLRPTSPAGNGQNKGLRTDNASGYKGVYWHTQSRRWRGQIYVDGRSVHLGSFGDPITAASAYDAAALDAWGEFARLNFPREDDA